MKYLYLLFILFLTSFKTNAEIIDGPANLRVAPKGDVLILLNDGLDVECDKIDKGWFYISFTINLTEKQYKKGYQIKKGEKLFGNNNKVIGIAIADIPHLSLSAHTTGGAPGNPAVYWVEIVGYVSKSNIKESSIPENKFVAIISQTKDALNFDNLKTYIIVNKYEKDDLLQKFYPKLNAYSIPESSVGGGSEVDRIRMIFEKDELIAIVHSRPLKIDNVIDYDLIYGNKILIFRPPNGENIKSFLKKNKEAYYGAN